MMNWTGLTNLFLNGLSEGLLIALGAVAMTLVFGVARFTNAATGDMMAFGAYVSMVCNTFLKMTLLLSSCVGVIATGMLAVMTHRYVFAKLQGRAAAMSLLVSIGVALVIRGFVMLIFGHEQRTFELPLTRSIDLGGLGILVQPLDLYVMGAAVLILAGVFVLLHMTVLGRQMRAVADNETLARASGIRVRRVHVYLWICVGAICAATGVFLGARSVLTPEVGFDILLPVFAAAVLGGLGSPFGAVLGGILLGVVQEMSVPVLGGSYKLATGFVVLLAVLLLRPQGIFGWRRSAK